MKIRAVIFDFDGVICQTETYMLDRSAQFCRDLGLEVELSGYYRLAGGAFGEREAILDSVFGKQARYPEVKQQVLDYRPPRHSFLPLLTEGTEETLKELKSEGFLLAVATNSRMERLRQGLEECRIISYFDDMESVFETDKRKPDPYVYTCLMQRMGLMPNECAVVEDSALGIRAGKAAGALVLALRDRYGAIDQSRADRIITQIRQVPACLQFYNQPTERRV